jgi:3-hydroxyacyl-[acyl-carrier-protein] dehydratase
VPGDQLVLNVALKAQRRGLWRFDCVAEVDGQVAAECTVSMVTRKEA